MSQQKIAQVWLDLRKTIQKNYNLRAYPILLNIGCEFAIKDRAKDRRVFAHTNHKDNVICVHPDLGLLPDRYIRGILAHEVGHILAARFFGDWSEEAADSFCLSTLHLPLRYDTFDGMWLQYIGR